MNPRIKQEQLLVLLTDNMREMETELRAHSIVLEALTDEIIEPAQIGEALLWARNSTAMLDYVARKYELFEKMLSVSDSASMTLGPLALADAGSYSH